MYKDLKNTIINTSYKLFMENGYDQTTVNDICAACSITKTTFYRYIDSKEELLSFFFDDINEKIDELKLNAETQTDYVQQIIDAFDLIIAHMLQFQQELYCQLYISNLKENKGTFNEIDALKEINQFVWVSLGDLHDVADEMELPTSVQTHLKIEDRVCKTGSETSVKQKYDMAKKIQYEQMLQYMDRYLGMLFSYLENTYEENELIVALFSDHGQGFLIPEDGQFLGPERTNIAFMFRNGQLKGETEEVMSSLDYTAILCKMAGIAYCEQGGEGRTPRIFGGSGRRWALTESLHPKDYYRAALVSENYRFYFCNPIPVGYDGRFEIGDYSICLTDKEGRNVYAEDVEKECLDIIMRQIANLCIY